MSGTTTLSIVDATALVEAAFTASKVSPENAAVTARALVSSEVDGQPGHGLSRVPTYAAQSRVGKVDGFATPSAQRIRPALTLIDAAHGFAYPALDLAVEKLAESARMNGIAAAVIRRSHHFGQAGKPCERLAEQGFAAFIYGNSPKAMAPWGGRAARLGTNPIAFAAPLPDGPPLVIDLALSRQARGKVLAAKKAGRSIPEGWALDPEGRPTTDPDAAMAGTMIPIGEAKGAALALMVEVMSACLSASCLAFEASSFLDDKGPPPGVGQSLIAVDVDAASGGQFAERMSTLLAAYAEDGVRLPGARRIENRARAAREGISVGDALLQEIRALAAAS